MKDPAILFYTGDFLNGCICLTMEERGQYITLLCLQHQSGHFSEKTIWLTVGSVSVDVMKKFQQDDEGLFFNERLDFEMKKRSQFIDSRKVNGAKGGRPKKPYGYAYAKPYAKAKNNLGEDENIIDNNIINNSNNALKNEEKKSVLSFQEFWNLYDKKVGDLTKLKRKFETIKEVDRLKIIEHLTKYKIAQPDKQFRKDPATYLNNQSWNDEVILRSASGKNGNPHPAVLQQTIDNDYANRF